MRTLALPCVLAMSIACAAAACAACSTAATVPARSDVGGDGGERDAAMAAEPDASVEALEVTVHAVVDLPRTLATQALSATAFDPATRTLFALQDKRVSIVPLVANEAFDAFTIGTPIALSGRPDVAYDGEGLVRTADGFIAVTNETKPTVEKLDFAGKRTAAVRMPAHYAEQATGNKGLESLSISPSGRFLFTANESALTMDGTAATRSAGTTVRILRREIATDADTEFAYRTEPLGAGVTTGDMGVAEVAALSDDSLLVLERGFQADYGNTVRIFRVTLAADHRVDMLAPLTSTTVVLPKTLFVDIGALPPGRVTHPAAQPNPLLDNYEALSVGPLLPDGRRLLFVTSDDNAAVTQVPRVLVLATRGL